MCIFLYARKVVIFQCLDSFSPAHTHQRLCGSVASLCNASALHEGHNASPARTLTCLAVLLVLAGVLYLTMTRCRVLFDEPCELCRV